MTRILIAWPLTACILAPLVGRFLARTEAAYRRHEAELTARACPDFIEPPEVDVEAVRRAMRLQLIDDLAGDFAREVDFRLDDVVREWAE